MKRADLVTMDGYEFQKFVANLFRGLGFVNVKVRPLVADGGIDIDMEQRSDVGSIQFRVECKHHPDSSIGRPTVQKLHSAVLHTPILDKGVIVTSGHFSSPAIKYAEEVGIELIDIDKLKELTKKVGLLLVAKTSLLIDNCFPISSKSDIISKLLLLLSSDLAGFDQKFVTVKEVGLELVSSYMVSYSINAKFATSVGLIHSINERSTLFLTGEEGAPVKSVITDPLYSNRYTISELTEDDIREFKLVRKGDYVKSYKEIKELAISALRQLYTKRVSYYGANNVLYTKTCTPNKRDVSIGDTKRVYLPVLRIIFSILKNDYAILCTEANQILNAMPSSMLIIKEPAIVYYPSNCMICSKDIAEDISEEKYLCNECGSIVCEKDSFECKLCGKLICREHTTFKRKFLILSDKYCPQCAKSMGEAA